MQVTLRQLRATASNYGRLVPPLTRREVERYEEILIESPGVLAAHARQNFSFNDIARMIRTTPVTLRRYFPDLDALISEILYRHLQGIAEAFGEIPRGPDRPRLCRQRYYNLTRTPMGNPTPHQIIMIRELHALPEDLRDRLAIMRHNLGVTMAGDHAEALLHLLDSPFLDFDDVEDSITAMAAGRAARAAKYQLPSLPPPPAPQPPADPEPEYQAASPPPEDPAAPTPPETPHTTTTAEPENQLEIEEKTKPETEPEPGYPPGEYDHLGIFDHAPSASDQFFIERGIPLRSRGPPK